MPTPSEVMRERGITLPPVSEPLASYVPAVRVGGVVYTAGQIPLRDGELIATGVVGSEPGDVSPEVAAECARQCALNALAAIASTGADLDTVRIAKVIGFVASRPEFTGQPGVLNGASHLIGELFGDAGVHARSAVGVASLPIGAPVEVEIIAHIT